MGVYLWGSPYMQVCLSHGIVGRQTPCEQTNMSNNITYPQPRLRTVTIVAMIAHSEYPIIYTDTTIHVLQAIELLGQ